jgi:hypothetical protein
LHTLAEVPFALDADLTSTAITVVGTALRVLARPCLQIAGLALCAAAHEAAVGADALLAAVVAVLALWALGVFGAGGGGHRIGLVLPIVSAVIAAVVASVCVTVVSVIGPVVRRNAPPRKALIGGTHAAADIQGHLLRPLIAPTGEQE